MQKTEIFLALKIENFQLNFFDSVLIVAQNIGCKNRLNKAILTSTHNLCFGAKKKKNNNKINVGIPMQTPFSPYKSGV